MSSLNASSALLTAVCLLALVASPGPAGGSPPDSAVRPAQVDIFVNMTTESLMFQPAEFRVPANASIHVRLVQREPIPHTFTLASARDEVIPTDSTPAELNAYFVDNNLTDVAIPDTIGTVVWANFTSPAEAGRYEFACRIAGHFQNGMYGFMVVEVRDVVVDLTMESLRFSPTEFTVPPGATVHVRITQRDSTPHTFTLGREKDFVISSGLTPAELNAYFEGNNLTDVAVPDVVGTVVWANFTAPGGPGRYEFACRIAGHFQAGMFGFMVVSESGGAPPPPPGLGLIPGIMVLTVGFVLVFAAVYHVRAVRGSKRTK